MRLIMLLLALRTTCAIMLFETGNPSAHTTAPDDPALAHCWNLMGTWNGFTGVPISSNRFLAAAHVGGSTNDLFNFRGTNYSTVAWAQATGMNGDLTIWTINGTFQEWAPLFRSGQELGLPALFIGRGTQRGREITAWCPAPVRPLPPNIGIDGPPPFLVYPEQVSVLATNVHLAGWACGPSDGVMRWGTNVLTQGSFSRYGCAFGPGCTVSTGDSSGACFAPDTDGLWKLVGMISYVGNQSYSETPGGPAISGAFFDAHGLYFGPNKIPCSGTINPTMGYITRVYLNLTWIDQVLQTQIP